MWVGDRAYSQYMCSGSVVPEGTVCDIAFALSVPLRAQTASPTASKAPALLPAALVAADQGGQRWGGLRRLAGRGIYILPAESQIHSQSQQHWLQRCEGLCRGVLGTGGHVQCECALQQQAGKRVVGFTNCCSDSDAGNFCAKNKGAEIKQGNALSC